jgi:hypothetical protein
MRKGGTTEHHARAKEKAQKLVMASENVIRKVNVPHILAIVTEILCFTDDPLDIKIHTRDGGERTEVSVSGYIKNIDDAEWIERFLGDNRRTECRRITTTQIMLKDNIPYKIFIIEALKMSTLGDPKQHALLGKPPAQHVVDHMKKRRAEAHKLAVQTMHSHANIPPEDRITFLTIFEELFYFEDPSPMLQRELIVTDNGNYELSVQGFQKLMDDRLWSSTFLSGDRSPECEPILGTMTQMTGPTIIKKFCIKSSVGVGASSQNVPKKRPIQ